MTPAVVAVTVAALRRCCAGLAGCGIPSQTDVQVDGRGPATLPGDRPPAGAASRRPPGTDSDDPRQFVQQLPRAAAAGETGRRLRPGQGSSSPRTVQRPAAGQAGQRGRHHVVRLPTDVAARSGARPQRRLVTWSRCAVQQVGVLRADGTSAPAAGRRTEPGTPSGVGTASSAAPAPGRGRALPARPAERAAAQRRRAAALLPSQTRSTSGAPTAAEPGARPALPGRGAVPAERRVDRGGRAG